MGNIFLEGVEWSFLTQIMGRTVFMFIMILLVLRLSGRRGVRQLTLFEVAIILGMGSAAGDPMFQKEVPLLYGVAVLFVITLVYKTVTWAASKSASMHRILEGREMLIVSDGLFEIKNEKNVDFSKEEFFNELRNRSVEHLGQVRTALLEVDGSLSILFFTTDQVRCGLPIFPKDYQQIDPQKAYSPIACMQCGYVIMEVPSGACICPRCQASKWAKTLKTERIG